MDRVVDPPGGAVEAHLLEQPRDQLPLSIDGEVTVQQRVVNAVAVSFHLRDHRSQLSLQLVEQPGDLAGAPAWLVVVE